MSANSPTSQFIETLNEYYEKLSGDHSYHFLITLDENDPNLNNEEIRQYLVNQTHLTYRYAKQLSTVESYNYDIDCFENPFKIILVVDGYTSPLEKSFDKIIFKKMNDNFPAYDGVIFFSTGMQNRTYTMPVLTHNPRS